MSTQEQKRKEFLAKEIKRSGTYGVYLDYKRIYGEKEAFNLFMTLPPKTQDRMQKTAYKLGLEDLDFRSGKDYSDPEAEKTFRN